MLQNILIWATPFVCFSLLTSCLSSASPADELPAAERNSLLQSVQEWNAAHASKEMSVFSKLYHSSVLFYGTQLDKNSCIEAKLDYFKNHPDFYQQLFGDIVVEKIKEGQVKCSFVKRVTVNQATTDYPSYLLFTKTIDRWVIMQESDLVTDTNNAQKAERISKIPQDAVQGDFNGDGHTDYMWLQPPKLAKNGIECIGDCIAYILFSDPSIPSIKVEGCIGGAPVNEGDLNSNGTDEVGLLPEWFTSCWRTYYLWTLKKKNWVEAVPPFSTHCNQWEEDVAPIQKDISREGNVVIRYSEMTEDGIVTKSASITIAK